MKTYLLSLLLTVVLAVAQAQPKAPVGIQLYTFRNEFAKDVTGTMAKVREMGFKEIEGGNTYGMSNADFRKLLDQNGLKLISMGAQFTELESNVPQIIDKAKTLGAKYVVCSWIPHQDDVFTFNDAQRAVEVFNTAGRLLKENGLNLCYHTHGYEFKPYEQGTLFDYLVNELDPRYCNFEMDVFWVKHPGQDPVAFLQKYGKRVPLVHLKDRKPGTPGNDKGRADVETNVTLGQGDIGIAEIMKQAKKSGVRHFFIEDESSRSMQQVPQSLAFLRTVM
ncbi:sugar phosphate isomerase/epimerase [Nibrella saemangeumensis]|uniref:Sugar phosphate isomerase/epimerase n=1 Tax=Nibrella saemangeumensis TaxID=1084526 RepID=A0ABP8MHS2_9BACT